MHTEIEAKESDSEAENHTAEKKESAMGRRLVAFVIFCGCGLSAWLAYLGYGDEAWTVALVSILSPWFWGYRLGGR